MHCIRQITEDYYWVGGDDRRISRFENIHPVPEGTSYNAYLLLDEKTVLFDGTDWEVGRRLLDNVEYVLDGRPLDYVIMNHMEPDHGASIEYIKSVYPEATVLCTAKAKGMMENFRFRMKNVEVVKEGDQVSFGKHTVTFFTAPMVHWPEVMVTYDLTDKILFSADGFGSFGAINGKMFADELDYKQHFEEYSRRYYANIVGKYGTNVQNLLKKLGDTPVNMICPLHGLIFRKPEDIAYILDKYQHWSNYEPEEKGIVICYASMYGGTEEAAENFAIRLCEKGFTNFEMYDVSGTHTSTLISAVFRYSHMALFSVTYNNGLYPPMAAFLEDMKALNVQKRTVSIVENGSWAPQAGKLIKAHIEELKDMTILDDVATIRSTMQEEDIQAIDRLAADMVDQLT